MPKICYIPRRFNRRYRLIIERANAILIEYAAQGFDLTLRQLYYQFVQRQWIPNNINEYKRLGDVIATARLAGEIDWNHITDRTRGIAGVAMYENPQHFLDSKLPTYRTQRWERQNTYVEVWIEKDALAGVFDRVCSSNFVSLLSCRGYNSISDMWEASQRLLYYQEEKQKNVIILHFGDHDPSGIDMTRDIGARLEIFGAHVEVRRMALNMDQIAMYGPPPGFAKELDPRFKSYKEIYGTDYWELDALSPVVLAALVDDEINKIKDHAIWEEDEAREALDRELLDTVKDNWESLTPHLEDTYLDTVVPIRRKRQAAWHCPNCKYTNIPRETIRNGHYIITYPSTKCSSCHKEK